MSGTGYPGEENYNWFFWDLTSIPASADWIHPVMALLMRIRNWPAYTFDIHMTEVWQYGSINSLVSLLKSKGIRVFGVMAFGRQCTISVRLAQAGHAHYWMTRYGVHPFNQPNVKRVRRAQRQSRATRKAKRQAKRQGRYGLAGAWLEFKHFMLR